MFDFGEIVLGLHKVVAATKVLSPFASILGVDKITSIVEAGLDIAENVTTRAKEAGTVLNSNQEEEIDGIISRLREENDKLAQYIDNS